MNNRLYKFEAILINGPFKGVYAELPFDSRQEFGSGKAIPVQVWIEGILYDLNLLPNGKGGHWLHLRKEIRENIGKQEGDYVHIELKRDYREKSVEIPEYLEWLLEDDPDTASIFHSLSYSSKKFWTEHIQEPKSDDAKVVRINRLFDFLISERSRKKTPKS